MASQADTEEPEFESRLQQDDFEIRFYQSKIIAEVDVSADENKAVNVGFRALADYIFGNNTLDQDIAMTAPVTQKRSTKIEMTAPVLQQAKNDEVWTVAFIMPAKWTMETLPRPNNSDVTLTQIPAELLATVRFNGRGRGKRREQKEASLRAWFTAQGYQATGPAKAAYYNGPWVPPMFRRNEVMVPVRALAD